MKIKKERDDIYKYKIRFGASLKMLQILKYPEQSLEIRDGAYCCVKGYAPCNKDYVKDEFIDKYKNLFEVKVYESSTDQQALIKEELLEELLPEEWITVAASSK